LWVLLKLGFWRNIDFYNPPKLDFARPHLAGYRFISYQKSALKAPTANAKSTEMEA